MSFHTYVRTMQGDMSIELPAPPVAFNGETAGKEVRDSRSIDRALMPLVIEIGDLSVNLDTKTVDVKAQRVHLTRKEY